MYCRNSSCKRDTCKLRRMGWHATSGVQPACGLRMCAVGTGHLQPLCLVHLAAHHWSCREGMQTGCMQADRMKADRMQAQHTAYLLGASGQAAHVDSARRPGRLGVEHLVPRLHLRRPGPVVRQRACRDEGIAISTRQPAVVDLANLSASIKMGQDGSAAADNAAARASQWSRQSTPTQSRQLCNHSQQLLGHTRQLGDLGIAVAQLLMEGGRAHARRHMQWRRRGRRQLQSEQVRGHATCDMHEKL